MIAAYNVQDCLARAVESVQAQAVQDFEVLVVDDGSRDATLDVAHRLASADARVRVFALGCNQGPSAARNRGIAQARGEWVSILDADDAFLPHRLGELLELARRRSADMVADDLLPYDLGANQLLPAAFGWTQEEPLLLDRLLASDGTNGRPLGWVQPVWRAAFLRAHGLAYPTEYRYMEDFFLLASALLCGAKIWLSPRAGYVYTLRHGPISQQASRFSATKPSVQDAGGVCRDLVGHYRNVLRPHQVRALNGLRRTLETNMAMKDALATSQQQGLLPALLILRRHPGAAWRLAIAKFSGIMGRMRRRAATRECGR